MTSDFDSPSRFLGAPGWAERTAPRNLLKRRVPSVLLIQSADENYWQVATLSETDAIADPNSFLGRLLRAHCALWSLPHFCNN